MPAAGANASIGAALAPTWRQRSRDLALAAPFLLLAGLFAWTTLCAIMNFGWRQPMFDQWREYETFLGLPFPQNVIQNANGHHPIVANVIRVAEAQWFGGNQMLQLAIGSLCVLTVAGVLAAAAWRERSLSLAARAAGVLTAVLGLLWLANARRLLHGSESLHGYLPTFGAMLACLCLLAARREDSSLRWTFAACAACVFATFSFGVGLASFGAAFALALALRLPRRHWFCLIGTALGCVAIYLFVLPGDGGVRGQLHLNPLDIVPVVARWTASPWVNGWLGYASQTGHIQGHGPYVGIYRSLAASAQRLIEATGIGVDGFALALGLLGIGIFALYTLWLGVRKRPLSRLELLAFGIAAYALAAALITSASRVGYFADNPDQMYADRYCLWPSLFWSCLVLLAIARIGRLNRVARVGGAMALLLLALALTASQNNQAIWGAIVYRNAQQTAAQLRSGVYDSAHFIAEGAGLPRERSEIELLRAHRLAMFADGAWQRVGEPFDGTLVRDDEVDAQARWSAPVANDFDGTQAAHLEGWITHGIAKVQRAGQLAVLDGRGSIVGLGEFGFISPISHALLGATPRKRGFDAYIRHFDPSQTYVLVALDFEHKRGVRLLELPAADPAAAH